MSRKLYYVEADTYEASVKEIKEKFLNNFQDYGGIVFKKQNLITDLIYNNVFDTIYEYYDKNKIMFNFYSLDVIQEPEKQYEYDVENNNTFCTNCRICQNCINCMNCINCNNCINCFYSKSCEYCKECQDCYKCYKCKDCFNCFKCEECKECQECQDCYKCYKCKDCKECLNCEGYKCYDCKECLNCEECTKCNNLHKPEKYNPEECKTNK